jgi:hypothetical protein
MDRHPGIVGLIPEVIPAVCFTVMVLAPRRRAPDLHRLAWLVLPVVLVLLFGPRDNGQNPILVAGVLLAVILVVAFALSMLPTDPRMAIAGAVPLSNLAIAVVCTDHDTSVLAWLTAAAAPAVLTVAITRTRRLQRRTPV